MMSAKVKLLLKHQPTELHINKYENDWFIRCTLSIVSQYS